MDMSVHFMRIQMARGPGTSTDRPNRGRRGGHRPHGSNRVSIRRVHEGQEKDKCPDSFVRLVSLRLAVDLYQPYSGLGRRQLQDEDAASCPSLPIRLPEELHVRYHDVDGVLDFLVLRSVFDEAINRSWNQGGSRRTVSSSSCSPFASSFTSSSSYFSTASSSSLAHSPSSFIIILPSFRSGTDQVDFRLRLPFHNRVTRQYFNFCVCLKVTSSFARLRSCGGAVTR